MKIKTLQKCCAALLCLIPSLGIAKPVKLLCEFTGLVTGSNSSVYTFDAEQGTFYGPFPSSSKVEISDDFITVGTSLDSVEFITQINRISGEFQKIGIRDGEEKVIATGSCTERKQAF